MVLTVEKKIKMGAKMRIILEFDLVVIPALKATNGYRATRTPFLITGRYVINPAMMGP